MAGTNQRAAALEGGPVVILVRPQLPENIGQAARAMYNFGLTELRLVAPRPAWPSVRAREVSSGADRVVEAAAVFETVEAALGDLQFTLATTTRERAMAKLIAPPEEAAPRLAARVRAGERVGIVFGAERTGLLSDEVALADEIVTIPANPAFASLNLAHAVAILGYEWLRASAGAPAPYVDRGASRLATRAELLGFFEHFEAALDEAGFLFPPDKRPTMVRNLRSLFHRAALSEQEVRTLRGVVTTLYDHVPGPRPRPWERSRASPRREEDGGEEEV